MTFRLKTEFPIRVMPVWGCCTFGAKTGPLKAAEIVYPHPWPATRRIPGQTLPVAGRVRRVLLTQCGPHGLLDTPPVLGIRQLPGCMGDHQPDEAKPTDSNEKGDDKGKGKDKKGKGKGKGKGGKKKPKGKK